MLPTNNKFGDWPMCGEIDIMEHVGHDAGKIHGTIHTEMCNHKKGTQVGNILNVDLEQWHTYGVAWSHDRLNFSTMGIGT
jgi:beta-glucanase (GH16 family)